jgi:hypothetical protein
MAGIGATRRLDRGLANGRFSIAASVKLRPDDFMAGTLLRSG